MHRTLKRAAIRPPRANAAAQPRAFDAFRREYNTERPHEYLGGETPSAHYASSPRSNPKQLPAQEYPGHFLVKKNTTGGTFRFQHRRLFIARSLTNHHIGLEETDDGIWSIFFNTVPNGPRGATARRRARRRPLSAAREARDRSPYSTHPD
ncbi:MAG: transposase [Gemmatimonadaceae bacterium]|nr:transposase [Gemmatimonadaceae bacterium]